MTTREDVLARLELEDCDCAFIWHPCSCRGCVKARTCTACHRDKHGEVSSPCALHRGFYPHPDALEECEHVLAAYERFPCVEDAAEQSRRDGALLTAWARLLLESDPAAYAEPRPCTSITPIQPGPKRVPVYASREEAGESLWGTDVGNIDRVGVLGSRVRNGREGERDGTVGVKVALEDHRQWESNHVSDRPDRHSFRGTAKPAGR